ncbi:MAG: sugar ABC transporter substrate-binding protein [Actinobacteria bacterium]|nr:sugar ABC transporter substrate-binding protein [Actinomycetota bacterium]
MPGCKTTTPTTAAETTTAETVAKTTVTETTAIETTTAKKQLTIGIVYLTLEHPYYQSFQMQWRNLAKENNFNLVELDGGLKAETETAAVESLIAQKVDAILFCLLDPSAAVPTIEKAQEAGIPLAAYAIRPGEEAQCPFVGYDEYPSAKVLGKDTAKLFMKLFPGKDAKIHVQNARTAEANVQREDGFVDGFKEVMTNFTVVSLGEDVAGNVEESMKAVQDALVAHPEINLVYGTNDSRAQGAVSALETAGRGSIDTELVAGYGGSEVACKYMLEEKNPWKITACIAIKDSAVLSYEVLMKMINGDIPIKTKKDFLTGEPIILSEPTLKQCQEYLEVNVGIKDWKP